MSESKEIYRSLKVLDKFIAEAKEKKQVAEVFSICQLSAAPQIQPPVREYLKSSGNLYTGKITSLKRFGTRAAKLG